MARASSLPRSGVGVSARDSPRRSRLRAAGAAGNGIPTPERGDEFIFNIPYSTFKMEMIPES